MSVENLKDTVEGYFSGKVTKKTIETAFHSGKFDNELEAYKNIELYLSLNSSGSELFNMVNKICPLNQPSGLLLSYKEFIPAWKRAMHLDETGHGTSIRRYKEVRKDYSYNDSLVYRLVNDNFYIAPGTYYGIWAGGKEDVREMAYGRGKDVPTSLRGKTYANSQQMKVGKEVVFSQLAAGIVDCDEDSLSRFFTPEKVFFESFEFVGARYYDRDAQGYVYK
jgi:hypothetical protein